MPHISKFAYTHLFFVNQKLARNGHVETLSQILCCGYVNISHMFCEFWRKVSLIVQVFSSHTSHLRDMRQWNRQTDYR